MKSFLLVVYLVNAALTMLPGVQSEERSLHDKVEMLIEEGVSVDKRSKPCPENAGRCVMPKWEQDLYVKAHNKLRASASLPPVKWDYTLCVQSEKLLDHQSNCNMHHADLECASHRLGQNLAWDWHSKKPHKDMNPKEAVQMWYDEVKEYNMGTKKCNPGKVCGHYTQVMWGQTSRVGCASRICGNAREIACDYYPPGNMMGENPWSKG